MVGGRAMMKRWLPLLCAAWVCIAASPARAESGVLLSPSQLSPRDRAKLDIGVRQARQTNAAVFARVAQARDLAERRTRARRGRHASVTLALRSLGAKALLPMLELLALRTPSKPQMSPAGRATLQVSLLEAVGELRDRRATPVLAAALRAAHHPDLAFAATEALCKLDSPSVTARLVRGLTDKASHLAARVAALGECRDLTAAHELSRWSRAKNPELSLAAVRGLANLGNAWAWKTPQLRAKPERQAVRELAGRALLVAYLRHSGRARNRTLKALKVVDYEGMPALIHAAQGRADTDNKQALRRLFAELAQARAR